LIVVVNFTPIPRHDYRIGVPAPGIYREIFNSDSALYGGSNLGNGAIPPVAENRPWMDRPYSITLTLPPLAGIILRSER
jgi:1,4-alpha-glucan branching enzyme